MCDLNTTFLSPVCYSVNGNITFFYKMFNLYPKATSQMCAISYKIDFIFCRLYKCNCSESVIQRIYSSNVILIILLYIYTVIIFYCTYRVT